MDLSLFSEFVRTLAVASLVNITLSFASFPLVLGFGALLVGLGSVPLKPVRLVVRGYIDAVRSTPLLLHLFFVFFGLPLWDIRFSAWTAAVVTMMLHFGAYQAEVFRSAISSIPKATREAAVALGMLRFTRFRRITLPLGFRISVPPTSNNLIDLFRGTSVVALVAVQDVVFKGTIMLQTYKGDSPTIFLIIALLFLAYGYPLLLITKALERRFGST